MDKTEDQTETTPTQADEVCLHCLPGQALPPQIQADWNCFLGLPPKARENIWEILTAILPTQPDQDTVAQKGEAFCKLYNIPADDLHRAVQVCRFLLGQAAGLDLTQEMFAHDLEKLSNGSNADAAMVVAGYKEAKAFMRQEILQLSFLDHGQVLTGIDWRIDTLTASSRGVNLNAPVIVLTLKYRQGGSETPQAQAREITLNLAPEMMAQLGRVSEKVVQLVAGESRKANGQGS